NNRLKAIAAININGTERTVGTIRLTSVQVNYINVNSTDKISQNNCVRLRGEIRELTPGLHGFHVHEFGNFSDGCQSTGPHFNPLNKDHGARVSEIRHVGDLGNINASADGVANVDLIDCKIKLKGVNSIVGRALVVHTEEDDLGKGTFEDSKTTGHSGSRIACGLITRRSEAQ
ncbi:superoxide dismutase [Cu-Zn] 4AP-like protein, partial [Leptotrombidium deliense]